MEFGDSNAIYLQIADQLSENILLRRWNPGDRIPSVRELAVSIEVNPNTVMRTFNFLQEKGIIYNKRGIGYFVSDDGFEKTKALRKENFINQELPRLFRELRLLNLTIEDLSSFYRQYEESKTRNVQHPK
jgi:DNA-binding transcriptional regulator YhcF (GntR family)